MPKISVVVPVYNVEKYIERCIQSIQNQTITDWELIMIDDCSPDRSSDIIAEYAKRDKRIILKKHESNHGPMMARRWGDKIASGDYITYCDGDDVLPNNSLQLLYDAAVKTGADIVSGNYTYVKTNGERKDCISILKYGNDGAGLLKALLRHEMEHILCSKLFKAEIIKGHDYRIIDHMTNGEDGYLFYQMIPFVNKIVQLSDIVYYYMQNLNSSSLRTYSENALDNMLLMNSMRVSLISEYPHLKKEILCYVSDMLNKLLIEGYNKNHQLDRLMKKHNLLQYSTNLTILKTHSLKESVKLLLRKYNIIHF